MTALQVLAALDASAAAGSIGFRSTSSIVNRSGARATVSLTEGVIDLARSQGRATETKAPGTPLATSSQIRLDNDDQYLLVNGSWELRLGGAASFLGLNSASASDALTVLRSTLPPDATWESTSAAGVGFVDVADGRALRETIPGEAEVAILIDPETGRLIGLIENRPTVRTDVRFTPFHVPLEIDSPIPSST